MSYRYICDRCNHYCFFTWNKRNAGVKMKVNIVFYDEKAQKETGKKELGVLPAFFYARYILKDEEIIEKLYSFIKYRISLWINGYSVSGGHCTVWTNDRRRS